MEETQNKSEEMEHNTVEETTEATAEETTQEVKEELTAEAKLQQDLDAMNDKYLRLMADFENYKRNAIKEKMETKKLANKDLMLAMVSVLDDFERGMETIEKVTDVASVKEGVELIQKKLFSTLESKGLAPMNAKGTKFDADVHEAICNVPAPKEEDKGMVVDVIEKGYKLQDTIIRYAKVVVGE